MKRLTAWEPNDDNTKAIHQLVRIEPDSVIVVMEATGGYESQLVQALHNHYIALAVVNPRRVRDFAKALGKDAKTDPIDARVIAYYGEIVKPVPRLAKSDDARTPPVFRNQSWQRYRIKDTDKGPEVWEVKWSEFWRKEQTGLPTRRHCLIVDRNVLSGEVKYFLSTRVPGEWNPIMGQWITLRWLLRGAFGPCSIESCFREAKEELGLDHDEVRGWRCVRRHFYVTQLSHLFCAGVRQDYDDPSGDQMDRISVEQVRSAMNIWLGAADLLPSVRRQRFEEELEKQQYCQRRSVQARKSHTKTRVKRLADMGINVDATTSCIPDDTNDHDPRRFVYSTYDNTKPQTGAVRLLTNLRTVAQMSPRPK